MNDASPPPQNKQDPYTQELPVDIPMKLEVTTNRWGRFVMLGGMFVVVFVIFLFSVNLGLIVSNSVAKLPNVSKLDEWHPAESTRLYDRNGNLMANISGDEDRTVMPLERISPYLPRAIMAIEDNRFYHHSGVDTRGTLRAIASNLKGGEVQGGSTLTQQLIKNLYLSSERSLGRKITEALLATRIEKLYDKDRILELYLNIVYWGNQAYGAEKAARRYFNISAEELTLGQAALLAGLLKAPEGLNPYVFPEAAKKRQLIVLGAMNHFGFITADQAEAASLEPLIYDRSKSSYQYPFFVNHVRQEMVRQFGDDIVRRGGLQVTTTMDTKLQDAAEASMQEAFKNAPKNSQLEQGGMVVMGIDGAEVLAMIGGRDFDESQFNTATMARRSPGSTFKPFVYLTGMRLGKITPDSYITDRPLSFNMGGWTWRPKNYDGVFKGRMKIRNALAQSRNTTTIQVGQMVGIDEVIDTAKAVGVRQSRIEPNFASLLGASGVSIMEMATAYSTFARAGEYIEPTVILKIRDSGGKEIYRNKTVVKQVIPKKYVGMLNSALRSVVLVGTGKKAAIEGRDVAGKTGTTDETRDIWFAGYTRDFTAVIWFGHPYNKPLHGMGSGYCVDTWKRFADDYYTINNTKPRELFQTPRAEKNS